MRNRAYTPKQRMTVEYNTTQAVAKVTMAPLHTLTDAMLASIARSHCGGREGAFDRLLGRLKELRSARIERERAHG